MTADIYANALAGLGNNINIKVLSNEVFSWAATECRP